MDIYATANAQTGGALALGTLVHASLAALDLSRQTAGLEAQIAMHADKLRLGCSTQRDEAKRLVEQFIASPRAADLRQARQLLRETEFLLAWPPANSPAADSQHPPDANGRYLQGYLDCLYQDAAGRWRVVDYKTNQVSSDTIAQLAATYEMQMLAYGLAAEQALGEPPAELVLHFLRTGAEHIYPWDSQARRRAVELVNQAIAAMCQARVP
jgi:ATP-dependent exoDNAse (exonuclease V) beta subunit